VEAIRERYPDARVVESMLAVEEIEFDLVVSGTRISSLEPHLYSIQIGNAILQPNTFGSIHTTSGSASVTYLAESRAQELHVSPSLPRPLQRLVTQLMMPLALQQSSHPVLDTFVTHKTAVSAQPTDLTPWVQDSRGQTLAGEFLGPGMLSVTWCLPPYITELTPWIQCACEIWSERDSVRFPALSPWSERTTWRVPGERDLATALAAVASERTRVNDDLDRKERDLERAMADVRDAADNGERRLITAQSAELVAVVLSALQELGFEVKDMDGIWPVGDKREDLRIFPPNSTQVRIAEVRGYQRGAQVGDLMRLARFCRRYGQDEKKPPYRQWYIVNQFRAEDPDTRDAPLSSNPNELEAFAEDEGLVIDTRQLFQLCMAVRTESLAADAARDALMASTGLFKLPTIA